MAARRDAGDGGGAIWATPEGTWLAPAKDEQHLADTALYGLLLPPGNARWCNVHPVALLGTSAMAARSPGQTTASR